ncbi:MATE family efflux transporter [Brumimicrobium aurantiacum]|uniref:Multidrug-efflux transporter n=1 Tax=Brumimicrobium aurantiacum TaxID=1737063 RepID=A0A3E1F100_9FLAO|nr:MATE family efflux transporter [Brumimicrobium aurantiacum]RFC55494.1 MATE family efflux transporter [Brumimicrobium aurantiacum]
MIFLNELFVSSVFDACIILSLFLFVMETQKEPTYRSIWKLALPAMLGGVVEPVLSLTDLAVVGNIGYDSFSENNENLSAVAAVGIAGSLLSALIWIFAQMKSAISAVVSQAYGSLKMRMMSSLIPQMIYFNAIVGVLAMVVTYFTSAWIFEYLLSASGPVLKDATSYFNIRVFGFPLTLITFSIFGVFRGVQNTWWAMVISIVGGTTNILLDFIFVLGWWNLVEPMGVEGAAWASFIAQIVMFILTIYFLLFKSKIKLIHTTRINSEFVNLLLIAGNLVLRTIVLNVALMLTHKYANIYGTVEAATHAVILNLWLFSAFFLDAFATSANALAGKFLGARNKVAMERNLNRNLMLSLIVSIGLAIVLMIFDEPIMELLIDNESVWAVYPIVLPLFALCLPFNALAFTLDGIFKGMGKAKFLRNILIISTLCGFLPVLLIGHYFSPGLQIIWFAIIAWMLLRGFLPYLYFKKWIRRF